MLETIRQFAISELELTLEGRDDAPRHMDQCLALAERMAAGLTGQQQRQFVTPVMMEQDSLRAATRPWAILRVNSR